MKKILSYPLLVIVLLSVLLAALPAFAEGTASVDMDALFMQATEVLSRPFRVAPEVDENHPLPEGVKLTGPFLYVGLNSDDSKVYMPDVSSHEYVPAGLAVGAKLYAADDAMIEDIYSGVISTDADAPVVYALLVGTGYYNGVHYENDLIVCDQDYAVVFVDYASGEIVAWTNGRVQRGGPFKLYSSGFYTDTNGKKVFDRDMRQLNGVWRDTLIYASADDAGAVIQNGVLIAMEDKDIETYVVPKGVREIGEQAFEYCVNLKSVTFPEGLKSIGWLAFGGCEQLEEIVFPKSLESIGINAFNGCARLKRVVLPEGLTTLGAEAFVDCAALSDITFPSTLTDVGSNAFDGTAWFAERENEPFIIVGDGVLLCTKATYDDEASEARAEILKEYGGDPANVSEDVLRMYEEAFGMPFSGSEFVIPEGVKYLAEYSIANIIVTRLVLPGTLTDNWGAMNSIMDITVEEIYISDGVTHVPGMVFEYCEGLKRVRIPASVTWLEEFLFSAKDSVTVICVQGSEAYRQARQYGYNVEIEE